MRIYKGDIFYADLTPVVGCEQGGIRPVLIIQNDIGNFYILCIYAPEEASDVYTLTFDIE